MGMGAVVAFQMFGVISAGIKASGAIRPSKLFGALYAPVQALMFNFTFEQTLSWIAAGLTFDIIHMAGNFAVGLLIFPLSEVLKKLVKNI